MRRAGFRGAGCSACFLNCAPGAWGGGTALSPGLFGAGGPAEAFAGASGLMLTVSYELFVRIQPRTGIYWSRFRK